MSSFPPIIIIIISIIACFHSFLLDVFFLPPSSFCAFTVFFFLSIHPPQSSSLQAFTVFVLYIRCSAIDPADPGVFGNQPLSKHDEKSSFSQASAAMTPAVTGAPLSPALSSPRSVLQSEKDDRRASYAEQGRVGWSAAPSLCSFAGFCGLCCGWMVIEDKCFNEGRLQQPVPEEDVLFCTLCNAEVRSLRVCGKSVFGHGLCLLREFVEETSLVASDQHIRTEFYFEVVTLQDLIECRLGSL
jgi:palmitoyltransferase